MLYGWMLDGSSDHLHAVSHGYRSAEGDSRLAELAAATNIKNAKMRRGARNPHHTLLFLVLVRVSKTE